MPVPSKADAQRSYVSHAWALIRTSAIELASPPSAPRRTEAAEKLRRQLLWLAIIGAAAVVVLMFGFDATEISMMPKRGDPSLWSARVLTDFGKDTYLLWALIAALVAVAIAGPLLHGAPRTRLLHLGTHLQYMFLALLLPIVFAEGIKWVVGRGRPFVGGKADPFNFAPFTGTEAYFSFPSAHSVTAFAFAFAVGAVWPRMRILMFAYAVVIAATRLVLLAHHPSDVVGGAVIGLIGAIAVRHHFAARQLGFGIAENGKIVPV
jgi:membrane-associated phospholipid phosphatase